jgi:hypothetical protein
MIEESPQTSLRSGASSCGMDRCCPPIVTSCGDHAHAPPDQGNDANLLRHQLASEPGGAAVMWPLAARPQVPNKRAARRQDHRTAKAIGHEIPAVRHADHYPLYSMPVHSPNWTTGKLRHYRFLRRIDYLQRALQAAWLGSGMSQGTDLGKQSSRIGVFGHGGLATVRRSPLPSGLLCPRSARDPKRDSLLRS